MQGIDFREQRFLDFILIQDYTQFSERRITVRFSEDIILFVEFLFVHFTGCADAVLIWVE